MLYLPTCAKFYFKNRHKLRESIEKTSTTKSFVSYRGIICTEIATCSTIRVCQSLRRKNSLDQSSPRICHSSEAVKASLSLFLQNGNSLNLTTRFFLCIFFLEKKSLNGSTQSSARAGNRSAGNA